jgi:serine/threonine protein kinase
MAIFDVGEGQIPYFVCELLEGVELRARLDSGPLPPKKAMAYAIQIARGLAAAHEKGFAHRDLKPENVMILAGDHVKILDFGLAKGLAREAATVGQTGPLLTELTMTGTILGTASYMSPEQIREMPADHRTDLFALGAILYEMLTGRRAFDGESHADRMSAILSKEPVPLDAAIEDALPGVSALIAHCLEKSPAARFQCAADVAFALGLVAAHAAERPLRPQRPRSSRRGPGGTRSAARPTARDRSSPRASRPTARRSATARPGRGARSSCSGPTRAAPNRARSAIRAPTCWRSRPRARWPSRCGARRAAGSSTRACWRACRSAAARRASCSTACSRPTGVPTAAS